MCKKLFGGQLGGPAPNPPGFTAFVRDPGVLKRARRTGARLRSRPLASALRVGSHRCPILRPGQTKYSTQNHANHKKQPPVGAGEPRPLTEPMRASVDEEWKTESVGPDPEDSRTPHARSSAA